MSVLIKGMEMPKNCLICDCTNSEWGECVLDPEKRCPEDYGQRAEWCPLIPVPPHGRLIDADKLKEEFPHDEDWDYPVNTNSYVVETIDKSPTIIEAEDD